MTLALKQITQLVLEFVFDVVRFPWWWYSGGLKLAALWCLARFQEARWRIGLGPFVRYLFTPMYGDYSLAGRVISFIARLLLVVVKSVRFVAVAVWYGVVFLGYLLLLPTVLLVLFT